MRRGTTPTITLEVTSQDDSALNLENADVYVTFKGKGKNGQILLTKSGGDVRVTTSGKASIVSTRLSQEETLSFKANTTAQVQVKANDNGNIIGTGIATIEIEEILNEEVI